MCKLLNLIWESIVAILALIGLASLAEASGLFDPPPPRRDLPIVIGASFAPKPVAYPFLQPEL